MCESTKPTKMEQKTGTDTVSPLTKLKAVYLSVFIDVIGIGLGKWVARRGSGS